MTKPKTKAGGSAPKPRSRNSNPKWFRDLKAQGALTAKDLAIWEVIKHEGLVLLQRRAFITARERDRQYQEKLAVHNDAMKEIHQLKATIEELKAQRSKSRESQAWGMLNSMMNCMEGNSRAVWALAEPMRDVVGELARELRKGSGIWARANQERDRSDD